MRILFMGDIVGSPARDFLARFLPRLRLEENLDCVIANGENSAGGSSITQEIAGELFRSGIDIITTGDHAFKKKEGKETVEKTEVLRPLNYGDAAAGRGYLIKDIKGTKVAVINLLGRVFMQPIDCPFKAVRAVLEDIKRQSRIVIVDMHAEATSEKLAMAYFLAGKVSAVLGTHTHIPTADERILDGSTAYITDAGMTGSFDSILGREKHPIIERFITNMPVRFNLAQGDVRIQGAVIEVDAQTGAASTIKRVEYRQDVIFKKS